MAINETTLLSEALKRADVIVLTAQILVNCLRSKEVSISDIDLLIMDECHHTDLSHPYNNIMKVSTQSTDDTNLDRFHSLNV